MLKNKIYNYFFNEIIKNFITILLTFTAIAWVVRAVNFLDLMVEDGYGSIIYLKYSFLNITNILTRFVPLAFLLSLTISIVKFERQQELLILWTTGLNKIKVINIFLLIGFFVTLFQLILSLFVNPYLLNTSRSMLSDTESLQINSILKTNDFSDAFKGVTFYIDEKSSDDELQNIFIKDVGGNFNTIIEEVGKKKESIIIAERGFIINNKLILFNGTIQTLSKKNEIKNIIFDRTELSLVNMSTRTIKKPKIQETSTASLLYCFFDLNECSKSFKNEASQNLSRRIGSPIYILLISIITSFLLIHKKEKSYNFLRKYFLFILSFAILIVAEILLKYTGMSSLIAITYFVTPMVISFLFYIYLIKKIMDEKVIK